MKKGLYAILLLLLCAVKQEVVAKRKRMLSQDVYEKVDTSDETSKPKRPKVKPRPVKSENKKKEKIDKKRRSEVSSEKRHVDAQPSRESQEASQKVTTDGHRKRTFSQNDKTRRRVLSQDVNKAKKQEAAKKAQARAERRADAHAQIEPQKILIEEQCKKADRADLRVKKLVRKVHKMEKKGFKAHRERLRNEDERKAARKQADALRIKERNLRSATPEAVKEAHQLDREINNVLGYSVIELQELEDSILDAKREAAHEAKQARKAQHKLAHYYKQAGVLGRVPCCKPEHVVRREKQRDQKKRDRDNERDKVYTKRDKQRTEDEIEQHKDAVRQLKDKRESARYEEVTEINKEIKRERKALKKALVKLIHIKKSLNKQGHGANGADEPKDTGYSKRQERRSHFMNESSYDEQDKERAALQEERKKEKEQSKEKRRKEKERSKKERKRLMEKKTSQRKSSKKESMKKESTDRKPAKKKSMHENRRRNYRLSKDVMENKDTSDSE